MEILSRNASPKCKYEKTSDNSQISYILLEKKGGRNSTFQNVSDIKEKERLWKCSWLKEAKETWQLNAPNPRLTPALEKQIGYERHFWVNWKNCIIDID